MGSNDTLITPMEVLEFDQSTDHGFASERCNFIIDVEEQLFNRCFGWSFYESLLADKAVYELSGTESDGEIPYHNYNRTSPYAAGAYIAHEGRMYTVLQDTNGTQAIADKRYFARAPKFKTELYETLWQRYLGRLIAFSVTNTSVMYRLLKDTAGGLVKQYVEGSSRPATLNEALALKNEAAIDIERTVANMEAFIKRNAAAFPAYGTTDGCADCNAATGSAFTRNLGFNF